jgi:ESS family glutamate:Na+ symporter
MTGALLQGLLKSTAGLGVLLLIGMFLRAKIPLFRKFLVPASVIGGFLGLLVGPEVLGLSGTTLISKEWCSTWSYLAGILVVPMFASIPLGVVFKKPSGGEGRKEAAKITIVSGIASGAFGFQVILGVGIPLLLMYFMPSLNFYNQFGYEICQGFNGGHSMAGAIGSILMEGGAPYWELSQGVVTTFATIGLLGGILLGVVIINRASRRGETTVLKGNATMPQKQALGFTKEIAEQPSMGRETTSGGSIETLTVHLAIILADCGLAYWLRGLFVQYHIIGLQDIPVWPYALLLMYIVNFIINKLKLQWIIDVKIKNHISGILADLSITAAIASMPIRAVMAYMLPILLISALGFVVVYYTTIKMFEWLLPDSFPFERGILSFGINTGVMMTGVTLLKICDPDFESPVMTDYSLSYAIRQVIELITTPIMYAILVRGTGIQMLIFGIVYTFMCYVIVAVGKILYGKGEKKVEVSSPATVV